MMTKVKKHVYTHKLDMNKKADRDFAIAYLKYMNSKSKTKRFS